MAGRFDILIIDEINKAVIMIENKIFAKISEYNNSKIKNQLELYHKYIEEKFSGYIKCLILLKYRSSDITNEIYGEIDYHAVHDILETIQSNDNIFREYKILLHSMIYDIYGTKIDLLKTLYKIRTNNSIFDLDLNEIEIILGAYNDK